ncbi:isochorismatase family protein [Candidatus Woesearchaeota archaeon]|nr:isochorismatase family protein [Candidatus Woesearchaeota archaeon]
MELETSPTIVPDLGVLVVDMQLEFLQDRSYRKKLIQRHKLLLKYCAEYDIPTVDINYLNCGMTVRPIRKAMKRIRRKYHLIKDDQNAFLQEELTSQLQEWDISTVFITGVYYPACVYKTAQGALDNGFSIMSAKNIVEYYKGVWDTLFIKSGGLFEDFREAFPLMKR